MGSEPTRGSVRRGAPGPTISPVPALLVSLLILVWPPTAWAEQPSAPSSRCNTTTLKCTYLHSSVGMLDGKPYAEAGREGPCS